MSTPSGATPRATSGSMPCACICRPYTADPRPRPPRGRPRITEPEITGDHQEEKKMKALVYDGPGKIDWRDHPDPTLQAGTHIPRRGSKTPSLGPRTRNTKGRRP